MVRLVHMDGLDPAARRTYTSRQAAALAGCSFRQLDYWLRNDTLAALSKGAQAQGSGSRRRFTQRDVALVAICARLAALGVWGTVLGRAMDFAEAQELTGLLVVYPDGRCQIGQQVSGHCWVVDLDAVFIGQEPVPVAV